MQISLPFLFLVALLGTTTIYAQDRNSSAPSPQSTQTKPGQVEVVPLATVSPNAVSMSPEERIIRLEERINLANERSQNAYNLLQFVGIFAALVLAFFSIRDVILRRKESQRQRGIDEIIKDMMNLQKTALEQQVRVGRLHLDQVEASPNPQFEAVQKVNQVIEVVRQTLDFRLQQEAKVAEVLADIEIMKAERDTAKQQKLKQARTILDHFEKMNRMQFATLTDEQRKRGIRLQELVNDLVSNFDELVKQQGFEVVGSLLYTCGVIAFYDNDVIEARAYLDRAAQCRADDHDGEIKTHESYRKRFAFTHYFRALIHKSWGDLHEAQHEIEQSAKHLEGQTEEFLTPVTRAEILSYIIGDESRCQTVLQELIERMDNLEAALKNDGNVLNANQLRLRVRILVLYGNTYFEQRRFEEALTKYTMALKYSPKDYYALASAAQCYSELGDEVAAAAHFRQTLEAIEHSGDFRKKRELTTRAVIAVIAANAARRCNDVTRWEQYDRDARDLLSGSLDVDGLSPRFFSPSSKRLVTATDLLKELDVSGRSSL